MCGDHAYQGHAPGEVFVSEQTEAIDRAIARGSIAQFTEAKPRESAPIQEVVKRLNVESHGS